MGATRGALQTTTSDCESMVGNAKRVGACLGLAEVPYLYEAKRDQYITATANLPPTVLFFFSFSARKPFSSPPPSVAFIPFRQHTMFARCLWGARFFSQAALATDTAAQALKTPAGAIKYPFFVPRNSNGNLPVYTDIRNGGTRILVSIRNVDGNASVRPMSSVFCL